MNIVLVKGTTKIEQFKAQVRSSKHAKLIKANQSLQSKKIVLILKSFKAGGLIKSIFRPKNKAMQVQLDNLSEAKRTIKNTIRQLNQIFR